jgi:hypothetical protein
MSSFAALYRAAARNNSLKHCIVCRGRSARPFRAPEVQSYSGNPGQPSTATALLDTLPAPAGLRMLFSHRSLQSFHKNPHPQRCCIDWSLDVLVTGSLHSRCSTAENPLQCTGARTCRSGETAGCISALCRVIPSFVTLLVVAAPGSQVVVFLWPRRKQRLQLLLTYLLTWLGYNPQHPGVKTARSQHGSWGKALLHSCHADSHRPYSASPGSVSLPRQLQGRCRQCAKHGAYSACLN